MTNIRMHLEYLEIKILPRVELFDKCATTYWAQGMLLRYENDRFVLLRHIILLHENASKIFCVCLKLLD